MPTTFTQAHIPFGGAQFTFGEFSVAYELSLVDGVASVVAPTDNNPENLPVVIENKYK